MFPIKNNINCSEPLNHICYYSFNLSQTRKYTFRCQLQNLNDFPNLDYSEPITNVSFQFILTFKSSFLHRFEQQLIPPSNAIRLSYYAMSRRTPSKLYMDSSYMCTVQPQRRTTPSRRVNKGRACGTQSYPRIQCTILVSIEPSIFSLFKKRDKIFTVTSRSCQFLTFYMQRDGSAKYIKQKLQSFTLLQK